MKRAIVHGSNGKMGGLIVRLLCENESGLKLLCGVDEMTTGRENYPYCRALGSVRETPDVIIDFSFHRLIGGVIDFATAKKCPLVVATTGFDEAEKSMLAAAAKQIPVFVSANLSSGIAALIDAVKRIAERFPEADFGIIELHHRDKADSPSGTALKIKEEIDSAREKALCGKNPTSAVTVHSLRMGKVFGEHTVIVDAGNEQIIIKHTAFDRTTFAQSAIRIAEKMCRAKTGLYTSEDEIVEREENK